MLKLIWNEEDAHKFYYLQGFAKGFAEGFKQGREESKLEMAKNLLKEKMSPEFIANITGLSKEEILKINNNVV